MKADFSMVAETSAPDLYIGDELEGKETGEYVGDPEESWPMFRHDPSHTGYSTSSVVDDPPVLWNDHLNAGISTPSIANGMIYFGSGQFHGDQAIFALDELTGTVVWKHPTVHYVDSAPAISNGLVIAGAAASEVYALDAFDGSPVWIFDRPRPPHVSIHYHSSPTVDETEGMVYVGASLNDHYTDEEWEEFFCLDLKDGHMIWSITESTKAGHVSSPAISEDAVFTGLGSRFLSLNKRTGDILWEYYRHNEVRASTPTLSNGIVFFVSSYDEYLYAFDQADGSLKWRHNFDSTWATASVAIHNGVVFAVDSDEGIIIAVNADTGDLIWDYVIGDRVISSPAVVDNRVLVSSYDGYLYVLDETDGNLVWRFFAGNIPRAGPSVADGLVFVADREGMMYVLGVPSSGKIEADIDCDPDTLNPRSRGRWITCYIELPSGFDPREIDPTTILLNEALPPELDPKYGFVRSEDSYIVDHDNDGTEERMLKFDRLEVANLLPSGVDVVLTITGELSDGTPFEGSDMINVLNASKWVPLYRPGVSWTSLSRFA